MTDNLLMERTPRRLDQECVVTLNDQTPRRKLCCIHTVSGQIGCYRGIADALDGDVAVVAIRAVGLRDGRRPNRTIGEMASYYLSQWELAFGSGPVFLAGWSTGGLIAWEMARRLRAGCGGVVLIDTELFLDQRSSQERFYAWRDRRLWFVFSSIVLGGDVQEMLEPNHPIWKVDRSERFAYILEMRNQCGRSSFWNTQTRGELERYFCFFKTQWKALRCIDLPARHDCPTAYIAPTVRRVEGWKEWEYFALGGVQVCVVPGDHISMIIGANARHLGAEVRKVLSGWESSRDVEVLGVGAEGERG